jgi:hypothetical protein
MTTRLSVRSFLAVVFAVTFVSIAPAQQRARKEPAIYPGPGIPTPVERALPPSRSIAMAPPATVALGGLAANERAMLGAVGMKQRIGVHRAVPNGSLDGGTWTTLADGSNVWRIAIRSEAATGMRVEFSNFDAGAGRVWVHSGASVDGPYTARGPYGNGEFWSGTVDGESLVIEYAAAATSAPAGGAPPFHVHRIAHEEFNPGASVTPLRASGPSNSSGVTPLAPASTQLADPAASCNLDVNCYSDWLNAKKSVAQIEFEETSGIEQGTFLCSGSAVATRDNSFTPYLLTAGHCIHDEAAARSLQTFWAYESPGCNLGPPANRGTLNSQNGGHLVQWATIENGDYSLVLLPNIPAGVVFAGWDTSDPDIGSPITGIHHPEGGYKRISFGNTLDGVDVFVGNDFAPGALYHQVNYTQGITEPGSSGSPLFTSPGIVVGTLTYGPDEPGEQLCAAGNDPAGYGKFSNAYTAALEPYLENLPYSEVMPSAATLNFNGLNHAITGSATQTITLTTQSANAVAFSLRSDASWATITPASGTVSASAPVKIQVTVNPTYFTQTDAYTTALTLLSGAAPPEYVDVNVNMVINLSNVVASATPNPVAESGTSWFLTLQLQETGGAATTVTQMKIDGVDYTSSIVPFFGSATLAAKGTLHGTIHTSGLVTPVTKYFEFFGQDVLSGQTWYRLLLVTFTD